MALDLLQAALLVLGGLLLIVGVAVTVAQVRFWYLGRKQMRETDRILRGRHR